ncbi:ATP-binding cassette domain-containing protein [Paenibacillus woosongensis]|uniref:ATP-binding cassette domain-containing protein n=1 Tax=Paenibacillus woosongensis TaxID=307580 RepID=A0AA95I5B3_9BACL|nr:ATP-binding cassette domain-containing protein [Paenibacillus woosongensis]WHX47072.1 ATP-binding cassette domain-containing protein [Paenibacillus woosongensis]
MEITLNDVFYSYNAGTPLENEVLRGLNLKLDSNKITAVVGRTGSGKSTFVQHLNGLLYPTRGSIHVGDTIIRSGSKRKPVLFDKVGIVFQMPEHQLFEETVLKDISFGPNQLGWPQDLIRAKALEALRLVGLDESFGDRSPFELSGGEKRRAAIAGVLVMEPSVLILDEPTVGLDTEGKQSLMELFLSWRKEKQRTLVIVTHDMDLLAEYAEDVIVFESGKVKLKTDPLTLFTYYRQEIESLGLKLPLALSLVEQLNAKLYTPITVESVKKEAILAQLADHFLIASGKGGV